MMKHTRKTVLATLALTAALAVRPAWSQTPPAPAQTPDILGFVHTFDIKPQPLGAALQKFAADTHVHLVFAAADVAGKTTRGIQGNYSVLESLTRLLTGTDLAFKHSDQDITLTANAVAPAGAHMTSGPTPELKAAWTGFYATMAELRGEIENTTRFRTEPWTRAKAYHTLLEAQAMAYNFVIAPRLDYPRMQEATAWQLNNYTLGQNGPDSFYGTLLLDGRQTYRITGKRGGVKLWLLQVLSHVMGHPDSKLIGNYDLSDFKTNADGSYEIILSATRQPGNWVKLDPNSRDNWLQVRRWMGDWNDGVGELHVEMISKPADGFYDDDEFSEAAMAKRVESATHLVKYLVESWNIGLYEMYLNSSNGELNHMALLPGTATSQVGSPTSKYALGLYNIAPDEALIVRLDTVPTDAAYWSFQLGDVWSRSLDFMNRKTSINMSEATIGADGKFWAVISRKDPGIANWLDTTDHPDGTIVFRNYRSRISTVPVVQKVKLADIWNYLPKDTARVTPEQRQAGIEHRREGLTKAYNGVF